MYPFPFPHRIKNPWLDDVNANSHNLKYLADPVDDQDAATKLWVLNQVEGENIWDRSGDVVTLHSAGELSISTPLYSQLFGIGDDRNKSDTADISLVECDVLRALEFGIGALRDYDDDLLGLGVPHRGTVSSVDGPHWATFVDDIYPVTQFVNWDHDNISIGFDCYTANGTDWLSSAPSSFRFYKDTTGNLRIQGDISIGAGTALSWDDLMVINANVSNGVTFPLVNVGNLIFSNSASPSTPAAGKVVMYVNGSGQLVALNSSGDDVIIL